MSKKVNEILEILKLKKDLFTDEGELLKNKLTEQTIRDDEELIKILKNNKLTQNMFFKKIEDFFIFNKDEFLNFISHKEFLPSSFTKFENKLFLADENGDRISHKDDVTLSFPYKECILEFDSTEEKEKRKEIFFNQTLMKNEIDSILEPKIFTNIVKVSETGEKKIDKYDCESLVIKGNNLIALHSLLPRFKGQIKCMYWDILYNTDNDEVPYSDSFKHSSWLVMMKNRIEIAKKLLKPDGVMVIQCDKNEDAYLKVLMDEIFTRDNFVNSISVQSSTPSGTKTTHRDKTIIKTKDTILVYKNGDKIKITPQYTEKTFWDTHYSSYFEVIDGEYNITPLRQILLRGGIISKSDKIDKDIIKNKKFYEFCLSNSDKIIRTSPSMPKDIKAMSKERKDEIIEYYDNNGNTQYALNGNRLNFLKNSIKKVNGELKLANLLCDLWIDIDFNNTQNEGGISLPSGKKPEELLKRVIEMFTEEGDIVLDAYLGSGTTAAVAHKLKRKYIGIEQLNSHANKTLTRMKNVIDGEQGGISKEIKWSGGGEFIYCELKDLSNQLLNEIKNSSKKQLDDIYTNLKNSPFLSYRVDEEELKKRKKEFNQLNDDDKKKILIKMVDKNTLYANYSEISDKNITNILNVEDYEFNKSFYESGEKIE